MFTKFHGIQLANDGFIKALRVEIVDVDPSPIVAGRIWYNSIEKTFKISDLDFEDNIVIKTISQEADEGSTSFALSVLALQIQQDPVEWGVTRTTASVTRTDVVFDPAESAYRAAYLQGAQTASGEGKSIVDRDRTETLVGESHRAAPDEKTRITRSDDV